MANNIRQQQYLRCVDDARKMKRYILARIPADGVRIYLTTEGESEPATHADLIPIHDENGVYDELEIETNEPDGTSIEMVYMHFRREDMTSFEWEQWLRNETPRDARRKLRAEYCGKVASLSVVEQQLVAAASESTPTRGEVLTLKAGQEYDGYSKGCLAHLVKLGLLQKNRGYLRVPRP